MQARLAESNCHSGHDSAHGPVVMTGQYAYLSAMQTSHKSLCGEAAAPHHHHPPLPPPHTRSQTDCKTPATDTCQVSDPFHQSCPQQHNPASHLWHYWCCIQLRKLCLLRPAADAPEEAPLDIWGSSSSSASNTPSAAAAVQLA